MSLKTRIRGALVVIGLFALLAGGLGWLSGSEGIRNVQDSNNARARSSMALANRLQNAGLAAASAISTRDPESLVILRDQRERLNSRLSEMRSRPSNSFDGTEADLATQVELTLVGIDRIQIALTAGRADDAARIFAATVEPRIRLTVEGLSNQTNILLDEATNQSLIARTAREQLGIASIVIGVAALLLSFILAFLVAQRTVAPLRAFVRRAEMFAEGDLISPTPDSADHEMHAVSRAITTAIESVRSAFGQVRDALTVIGGSSGQFVDSARQFAAGAHEQAAAVGEISETMEQLSIAAQQIAAGATQATLAAADGREAVDLTARGVAAIRNAVHNATERGGSLRLGSDQVGGVADSISSIAERTHILALNAAIEAAAAGEYGRRFGVVAGQVRDLSEDTRRATEQVKATLFGLRDAIAAVEASGAEASELASRVDDQAQRASTAIANMVAIVETIARATVSQHGASSELVRTMREIVEVARESAASSQLAADGAARLNRTAVDLDGMVSRFRLVAPPP